MNKISMTTISLFQHPHYRYPLPISNRYSNSPELPISLRPVKRHSGQSAAHLKPRKTCRRSSVLRSLQ
jgi:hypothetical protein